MRDITAHELDKVWSTAELESLPRGSTMWNPFAVLIMAGNERAEKLGRQWQQLHDGYQDGPAPNVDHSDDPLANILADAALKKSGIHIVTNHETGDTGVFPARKPSYSRDEELDWELRAQAMHASQGILDLPDLLPETATGERPTFHGQMAKEPPKYEDWIKTQRGD